MCCKYPVETSRLVLYPSLHPISLPWAWTSELGPLTWVWPLLAEVRAACNDGYSNMGRAAVLIPAVPWLWGTSELCLWSHANSTEKNVEIDSSYRQEVKPSFVAFQQVYNARVFSLHCWKQFIASQHSRLLDFPTHPIIIECWACLWCNFLIKHNVVISPGTLWQHIIARTC